MEIKHRFSTLIPILFLAGIIQAQPTLDRLVSFAPWDANELSPYGGLTLGNDGNFYGTRSAGDINSGAGAVFRVTPGGIITTLVTFNHTNGANPRARLTLGNDGNFYGTTDEGGTKNGAVGTVFQISTNGTLTTLANFFGTNGSHPVAALTLGKDGDFYGTTSLGGNPGYGTVFKVTTNGALTTLANFDGINGGNPTAELTAGSDGHFYGIADGGGSFDYGTVFRVTTNGSLTTLASFDKTNGAFSWLFPSPGLALGSDGAFYGTTIAGGSSDKGTVFKVTTNGTLTTLVHFNVTNGNMPLGTLTPANDGCFYGTTIGAGYNNGTIYRVTTNGILTTIANFNGTNGRWPMTSLALGQDGNFYGTTAEGGVSYDGNEVGAGTVFKLVIPPAINCFSHSNAVSEAFICGLARPFVQIQATTNLGLSSWVALTNLDFHNGTNTFSDTTATNLPARFYRVMVQ